MNKEGKEKAFFLISITNLRLSNNLTKATPVILATEETEIKRIIV
jgi:hypothetical protein